MDNFELAARQLKLETEGEERVNAAYQGLYKQMVELFRGLGLEATPGEWGCFKPKSAAAAGGGWGVEGWGGMAVVAVLALNDVACTLTHRPGGCQQHSCPPLIRCPLGVSAGVGSPFDPNLHDGIMREASNEVPDGTVLEEFRKGFMIGDKLLRPAMVKVSFTEDAPPAPAAAEGEGAAEEAASGSE